MPTIGSGLASLGDDIANAMLQYNQEHRKYDEAYSLVEGLSRIGIDKRTGAPVQIQFDEKGKPLKDENIMTFGDPKAIEQYKNFNRRQAAGNMGRMDALGRIMASGISRAQAAAIEDASLSGQATRQRIQQAEASFGPEQESRRLANERAKQIIKEGKKQKDRDWVPGYGWMTPKELSVHTARQERLKMAKEKIDPMIKFERDELQTKYGLTIQDVLGATTGTFDVGVPETAGKKRQLAVGVPYIDAAGQPVSAEQYTKDVGTRAYTTKHPTVWALVGPNKTRVPVHEWSEIVGKAKNFAVQNIDPLSEQKRLQKENEVIQATNIMNRLAPKDPKTWTEEDNTAYQWAQGALAQQQ